MDPKILSAIAVIGVLVSISFSLVFYKPAEQTQKPPIATTSAEPFVQQEPQREEEYEPIGLIGRWSLDNAVEGLQDSSPSRNNGILKGTAAIIEGKSGTALKLDRSYLEFGLPNTIKSPFISISTWVSLETDHKGGTILELKPQRADLSGGAALSISASGEPVFTVSTTEGSNSITGSQLNPGIWHHLVGIFTGEQLRLYIDGKPTVPVPASGKIDWANDLSGQQATPAHISIGASTGETATNLLKATIDEAQIYDVPLSDLNIQRLFSSPESKIG